MQMTRLWVLLVVASVTLGCQANDSASSASDAKTPAASNDAAPEAAAAGGGQVSTGTIEIGGEAWTIVPIIQCSVFPGPVASISGHAANDESIKITLDYSPGNSLVAAAVENSEGTLNWMAMGEQVTFRVDGDHVTGEGRFTWQGPGAAREAQGKFDVRCR